MNALSNPLNNRTCCWKNALLEVVFPFKNICEYYDLHV